MPGAIAFLALGSNLGDRKAHLDQALEELRSHPDLIVRQVSRYYETPPAGGPLGQSPYLNAAAEVETTLAPKPLLQVLLEVERKLGRVRDDGNGPRNVDLDLLLHDERILDSERLTVPHPRMQDRLFVLDPLAEIAADAVHPLLHRTIRELLAQLRSQLTHSPTPGRELTGLRALVTGSTSGIGRAIASELAAAGADVLMHGRRSAHAAQQSCELALAQHVRSHWVLADLRSAEECAELVESAWKEWDGLDIWVNNAGADTLTGETAAWSFERKWQELQAVDVMATLRLSRSVGERMKHKGAGVIVNMGWDQAETGMEGDSSQLFAAAKGAVAAFTKSLAVSLAPQVRVNCVAPGWSRTAWGRSASQA
jgi:3-oxoacyl-[acyl-carrier protein] reductase